MAPAMVRVPAVMLLLLLAGAESTQTEDAELYTGEGGGHCTETANDRKRRTVRR